MAFAGFGWSGLLAIGFKCFVKLDPALWDVAIERQGEENLFRHARVQKARNIPETEAPVSCVRVPFLQWATMLFSSVLCFPIRSGA